MDILESACSVLPKVFIKLFLSYILVSLCISAASTLLGAPTKCFVHPNIIQPNLSKPVDFLLEEFSNFPINSSKEAIFLNS